MNKLKETVKLSKLLVYSIIGECIKKYIAIRGFHLKSNGINIAKKRNEEIIISLTSYGRRVKDILPFTIYSLLRQTLKPDRVVLWLDEENWNEDNIPEEIKELQKYGLTVRFCEDLKSYKKHVTALRSYPNAVIITTDDDFYYSSKMLERLISAYTKDRTRLYTLRAHRPLFDVHGEILPYNNWKLLEHNSSKGPLFPTTGGGCLLKRELLHKDALDKNLFTTLCPKADDVWFYFMGVLMKTPVTVLPSWPFMMIPLDVFYQKTHKGASLQDENRGMSLNDKQIRNTMERYNLKAEDLIF